MKQCEDISYCGAPVNTLAARSNLSSGSSATPASPVGWEPPLDPMKCRVSARVRRKPAVSVKTARKELRIKNCIIAINASVQFPLIRYRKRCASRPGSAKRGFSTARATGRMTELYETDAQTDFSDADVRIVWRSVCSGLYCPSPWLGRCKKTSRSPTSVRDRISE